MGLEALCYAVSSCAKYSLYSCAGSTCRCNHHSQQFYLNDTYIKLLFFHNGAFYLSKRKQYLEKIINISILVTCLIIFSFFLCFPSFNINLDLYFGPFFLLEQHYTEIRDKNKNSNIRYKSANSIYMSKGFYRLPAALLLGTG